MTRCVRDGSAENLPAGPRANIFKDRVTEIEPLLAALNDIGAANGGKTSGQVALNWVMCKGAIPIPGARSEKQALDNAGAMGWRMSDEEVTVWLSLHFSLFRELGNCEVLRAEDRVWGVDWVQVARLDDTSKPFAKFPGMPLAEM